MGESWTKKMGESADSGGYRGISKGELIGVFREQPHEVKGRKEVIWRRGRKEEKRKLAGEGDSLSWVKERKTGSSWEDSLKKKKSGEQNRGTGREREELGKRG